MALKIKHFALVLMAILIIAACHSEYVDTTSPAMTAKIRLPKTGQILCYNAAGAIISGEGTGQDGEVLSGGTWANPRFSNQNNGTLLDNNTGLIWAMDANAPGPMECNPATIKNWQAALDYVKCLNTNRYLGYADWRLPNVTELGSLVDISQPNVSTWLVGQGFKNVKSEAYWSSSSAADGPSSAWGVGMDVGDIDGDDKSDSSYVWTVRSAEPGLFEYFLPRTGQSVCYDFTGEETACTGSGQDSDLKMGEDWPKPRFADLMNGTMKDNLTGLIWAKDANAPGPAMCTPAKTKNWQAALDYVKCLNTNRYLGFTDWHLPNRNEISSIVDYSQPNQATWLVSLGFTGVQSVYYWSSSSCAKSTSDAWGVDMGDGDIDGDKKIYSQFVWPVRTGQ